MPFFFLRYISPAWYFHLAAHAGAVAYFADYRKLPEAAQSLIDLDPGYEGEHSRLWDAAYQAWHKGLIESDTKKALPEAGQQPSLADQYRFIRKYFHPLWSWYVLILRLLTLHNPFLEIGGFLSQRKVRRTDVYKKTYPHGQAIRSFESPLLRQVPKVSVIIPTLNRYAWLKDALHDLEKQDYPNFEVIVVDQSEPFQPAFYEPFQVDIRLIRQEEKALWLARNTAIQAATGEYFAMYEDDVRVPGCWLSNHLKCLDYFQADISAGVFFPAGSKLPLGRSFFRWAEQFATGNSCLRREVFQKIGLFDQQFERQRMGDGEFGLRAYLAGFKSIANPHAWCEDVKAPKGGLRQMGSWDGFRPKSWLAPRPVPSVLYLVRKYFGNRAAVYSLLISVPPSLLPYRYKGKPHWLWMGALLMVPLLPLVAWQVARSWSVSSRMLREGPKMSYLQE